MTSKDENRAAYPEMTAIIDQVRATGGTVTAAWVEDEEGRVLVGRRPQGEHRWACAGGTHTAGSARKAAAHGARGSD